MAATGLYLAFGSHIYCNSPPPSPAPFIFLPLYFIPLIIQCEQVVEATGHLRYPPPLSKAVVYDQMNY